MRMFWQVAPVWSESLESAGGGGGVEGEGKGQETAVAEPKTSETVETNESVVTPVPAPAKQDWRDRRIAQLTARLAEAKTTAAATQVEPPSGGDDSAKIEKLANERAAQIAAATEFNKRCDTAAELGRTTYGANEFNERVSALQSLVDKSNQQEIFSYTNLLDAAIETGEGPRLLHELGGNLNEAARILALSPARMGIELAKRAAKAPVQVSGVAKPVVPVGTQGRSHDRIDPTDPDKSDNLSTAEWMRRREAQLRQEKAA